MINMISSSTGERRPSRSPCAKPLPGKPWIWRPAFFGAFPAVVYRNASIGLPCSALCAGRAAGCTDTRHI